MSAKKVIDLNFARFLKRANEARSGIKHYRLGPDHAVEECSMEEWVEMFGDAASRIVARTDVDGVRVSTVFLGLDHNFWGDGPPLLFESMTFPDPGSGHDIDMDRYSTWAEAVAGHAEMVRRVRNKVVQFRRKK